MGKGDRRTKKGKIVKGSFGNSRPKASKIRKEKGIGPKTETKKAEAAKKSAAKKAAPKKAAPKKAEAKKTEEKETQD